MCIVQVVDKYSWRVRVDLLDSTNSGDFVKSRRRRGEEENDDHDDGDLGLTQLHARRSTSTQECSEERQLWLYQR